MFFLLGVLCMGVIGTALPITRNDGSIPIAVVSPQVPTAQGIVRGTVAEDGEHLEFYGIPYADTTAGNHRFKAPLPPPSFTDVFIANRKNVNCLRPLGNGFDGTEDCLVADILTPSTNEDNNLPVMVWVKGSEFTRSNENELSFKNFVDKDVVVVSLTYRQSIFGFLCLGTETAPGNAGLKDIIAGLRWVKANINNFGGNPDDITLFGHGSSAAAVDLVTLSPMAEGLVQKAISQSGTALAPWAVSRDNLKSAIQVAEALGHSNPTTVEDLSELFTRVSAPALLAIVNEFELTDNSLVFAPCVEREITDVEPFLLNTPFEIISEGNFPPIPFMTGFVQNEGTIRAEEIEDSQWLNEMEESFSNFLQADLQFEDDYQRNEVARHVREFYFDDSNIPDNIQRSIAYHGDTMVLVSTIREAHLRARTSSPLYVYQFSYKGTLGEPFVGPIEVDGTAHSEELGYLFHDSPLIVDDGEISNRDLVTGDILVERWTNFAKTGNPTSETSDSEWLPFTNENQYILQINDNEDDENLLVRTLDMTITNPYSEVVEFWDGIYEEHFLDAQSTWEMDSRDEEEDTTLAPTTTTTEGPTVAPDESTDETIGETSTEEITTEEITTEEPQPDSASTAVGYTFMIVAAFALLDKFHSAQILS